MQPNDFLVQPKDLLVQSKDVLVQSKDPEVHSKDRFCFRVAAKQKRRRKVDDLL